MYYYIQGTRPYLSHKGMIAASRYKQYIASLSEAEQQTLRDRLQVLVGENREYCDRGNYTHLSNILTTIALDELLQSGGKTPAKHKASNRNSVPPALAHPHLTRLFVSTKHSDTWIHKTYLHLHSMTYSLNTILSLSNCETLAIIALDRRPFSLPSIANVYCHPLPIYCHPLPSIAKRSHFL